MDRSSLPPLEDDFTRALLGSAESDAPSNAAYAKAAASLGVGLGVGASLPVPAAVALGAAGGAGLARSSSSLAAKLLALGVTGALFVGAGVLLVRNSEPAKPGAGTATLRPSHAPAAPAIREQAPAARGLPSRQVEASVPPLGSGSASAAAKAKPAPRVAPLAAVHPLGRARRVSPARVSADSSLAEQVQSLDRARVALGSGDSSAVLREIAHYRAAWPNGVFLTEASVLEIEALAARGERSLAQARAADFVAAHPDSPQAARLRSLIPAQKR